MMRWLRFTPAIATIILGIAFAAGAQDIPADYQQVLTRLGKQGDFKDGVLKVNIPRNDLGGAAPLLHARARSRHAGRSGDEGEAGD